jgi:hypothetical protein
MDYHETNRRIIESKLRECLDKVCKACNIQFNEWDVDHRLAEAIIKEWNKKSLDYSGYLRYWFNQYDNIYAVAEAMSTKLGNEYFLFTNLNEEKPLTKNKK